MTDHDLVGKMLIGIKIADDKKAILFETDSGNVVAKTDGDCCSNSWVENIELPALGFPCTVAAVGNLQMPDLGNSGEYGEVIAYYGCKIVTDKGEIIIDYRNESNGYYGGNLSWPSDDDCFYGGVYGQNISTEKWIDLK